MTTYKEQVHTEQLFEHQLGDEDGNGEAENHKGDDGSFLYL